MRYSRDGRLTRGLPALLLGFTGASIGALFLVDGFVGWGVALVTASLLLAGVFYRWAGRSGDVAAALRGNGDERQRRLDLDATAAAGGIMAGAAIIGAIVESGRTGDPGGYGVICAVGGVAYAARFALGNRYGSASRRRQSGRPGDGRIE